MDYSDFRRGEPQPRQRLPKWQLHRVPPSEFYLEATIVSSHVLSVDTHFDGKKRVLCMQKSCDPALHHRGSRWYGYFQVIVPRFDTVGLLEVPEDCFHDMRSHLQDHSQSFRGLVYRFRRVDQKKNSRIEVKFMKILCGIEPLPDEIDVFPMILKLFQMG